MTWEELRAWVNDPTRNRGELQQACQGLGGLPKGGNVDQIRRRLLGHIAAQPDLDAPASWSPAGYVSPARGPAWPQGHGGDQPPAAAPPARRRYDDDDEYYTRRYREERPDYRGAIFALAGAIVIAVIGGILLWDHLDDDDDNVATLGVPGEDDGNGGDADELTPEWAASEVGGDADDWEVHVEDHALIYDGPEADMDIPEGYRLDYPGHTCEHAGGDPGVYGPEEAEDIREATLWLVPGEDECPEGTGFARGQDDEDEEGDERSDEESDEDNSEDDDKDEEDSNESSNEGTVPCPTDTRKVSEMITGSEGALVRETQGEQDKCLFEYRSSLDDDNEVDCPEGWACEFDMAGSEEGKYFYGPVQGLHIDAGSWRLIAAYPEGDPIHEPCEALESSREHLEFQKVFDWEMHPGNFDCGGKSSQTTTQTSSGSCPTNPEEAGMLLGGAASSWRSLGEDGWKYEGALVSLTHPGFGRIDYDGGNASSGSTPNGTVFTFWCNAA